MASSTQATNPATPPSRTLPLTTPLCNELDSMKSKKKINIFFLLFAFLKKKRNRKLLQLQWRSGKITEGGLA